MVNSPTRGLPYLEVDHVDRIFHLPGGGSYVALRNIHLEIRQGEFIALIGHSGCGKSTLLNLVAGLDQPTRGGIILEGRQVTEPGPERMVVFQNYSLLPWLTVRDNIALVVDQVLHHLPQGQRREIVEESLHLVHLQAAAYKRPSQLSGGMKQRVAIARALAIKPKLLLLDEPFGALDALTRGKLQEQLMQICQDHKLTSIMVTHDVDEALLLSDRVVMLTNGPEAHIGKILKVPFPRPRQHLEVVNDPSYYALRSEVLYFLNQQKRAKQRQSSLRVAIPAYGLEKVNLEIGFIPLTDCAPLVVAKEKGFFAKHGLEQVTLSREPSWEAIAEGVSSGRLDAAQMVAGMPLALTMGLGGTKVPITTALTLSRNGNAITLAHRYDALGVRTVADFKHLLEQTPDQIHTLGMVHPASMHNLILRHWLASGGIHPDRDVHLTVIPPPQMMAHLRAGHIDGYCVGEPWNARAIHEGVGFAIATDLDIWPGHVEKVLGVRETWAQLYPKTHIALVKALIEACQYCDLHHHREEILGWLCQGSYLGSDPAYTRCGFLDPYPMRPGDEPRRLLTFHQFASGRNLCPDRIENLWILTQLARWSILPFPSNWLEILERVEGIQVYTAAARQLGLVETPLDRGPIQFTDGSCFMPDNPFGYLESLTLKNSLDFQEISLESPTAVH